jgi:hypothetical protein
MMSQEREFVIIIALRASSLIFCRLLKP